MHVVIVTERERR